MTWLNHVSGGEGWTWLHRGEPCEVVAVGWDGKKVVALKARLENKAEVVCWPDDDGIWPDLQYGPVG